MQLFGTLLLIVIVELSIHVVIASLHSQFHHFEILTPQQITTIVKRDARTRKVSRKYLHFRSYGMRFKLSLTPGWVVVDDTLDSRLVLANGSTQRFQVDLSQVFSGKLNDDFHSSVQAFQYGGEWTARIENSIDVFMIEPMRRYEPHSLTKRMILYRSRDVIVHNSSVEFSPTCYLYNSNKYFERIKTKSPATKRLKTLQFFKYASRSTHGTVCDMRAIVDTECLRKYFNNDIQLAAMKVLYFHEVSAKLFRSTDWGHAGDLTNKVRSLLIHSEYTAWNCQRYRYNIDKSSKLDPLSFLQDTWFYNLDNKEYCSNVLSSFRQIKYHTLGAAATGYLCALKHDIPAYYGGAGNTAVTTLNLQDRSIPDAMYIMVLTHEIGHLWGAEHDDVNNPKCGGITDELGGKYIMIERISSPTLPNNRKFSPCSIKAISNRVKSFGCLLRKQDSKTNVCGNGIVEGGESCDAIGGLSRCCNSTTCGLLLGAVCEPSSSPCCTPACKIAPKKQKCSSLCHTEGFCDGINSTSCPGMETLPNGEVCGFDKKTLTNLTCHQGRCISECVRHGQNERPHRNLLPCLCGKTERENCSYCCKDLSDGLCKGILCDFDQMTTKMDDQHTVRSSDPITTLKSEQGKVRSNDSSTTLKNYQGTVRSDDPSTTTSNYLNATKIRDRNITISNHQHTTIRNGQNTTKIETEIQKQDKASFYLIVIGITFLVSLLFYWCICWCFVRKTKQTDNEEQNLAEQEITSKRTSSRASGYYTSQSLDQEVPVGEENFQTPTPGLAHDTESDADSDFTSNIESTTTYFDSHLGLQKGSVSLLQHH